MNAYMISVLTVSAAVTIAGTLTPADKSTGKYIKYISGLISLCVIATPIISAIKDPVSLPDVITTPEAADTYDYDFYDAMIKETERALCAEISEDIRSAFGIEKKDINVNVTLDCEDYLDIKIARVKVTLTSYGAWTDADRLTRYIEEKYECEAELTYE